MDTKKVGEQIAMLRKSKNLTQNELGERLGITFQAVSKWERGETLPDISMLVDLANVLETTTDYILTGGEKSLTFKGKITVSDMIKGIHCIENMGKYLGVENIIYRYAVNGINEGMNTNIEECYVNDYIFEAFVAEAIIQKLKVGTYIDTTDIRNNFKHEHFRDVVLKECAKYGIK